MDGFGWNAIYSDGEILARYNEDGTENSYADIDRDRLKVFEVVKGNAITGGNVAFKVFFERPTQKLIYRRRVFVDAVGVTTGVVVMVGWHENVNGTSVKSIAYIYPDGHVELDGSRNDLELIPCEE